MTWKKVPCQDRTTHQFVSRQAIFVSPSILYDMEKQTELPLFNLIHYLDHYFEPVAAACDNPPEGSDFAAIYAELAEVTAWIELGIELTFFPEKESIIWWNHHRPTFVSGLEKVRRELEGMLPARLLLWFIQASQATEKLPGLGEFDDSKNFSILPGLTEPLDVSKSRLCRDKFHACPWGDAAERLGSPCWRPCICSGHSNVANQNLESRRLLL